MKQRVLVIGGGISGLTSAIYAQKSGFDTLILESTVNLGGECTGWDRQGFHIDNSLHWLLGTDQWDELHRWGRYDYLVEHLTFIVCHRGHAPAPREGVRAVFLQGVHPASASEIRRRLAEGAPVPEGWMHPACEEYARRSI